MKKARNRRRVAIDRLFSKIADHLSLSIECDPYCDEAEALAESAGKEALFSLVFHSHLQEFLDEAIDTIRRDREPPATSMSARDARRILKQLAVFESELREVISAEAKAKAKAEYVKDWERAVAEAVADKAEQERLAVACSSCLRAHGPRWYANDSHRLCLTCATSALQRCGPGFLESNGYTLRAATQA